MLFFLVTTVKICAKCWVLHENQSWPCTPSPLPAVLATVLVCCLETWLTEQTHALEGLQSSVFTKYDHVISMDIQHMKLLPIFITHC